MSQPSDTCPTCKGYLFVYTEYDFKAIPCPACKGGDFNSRRLLAACGVPAPLQTYTWTTKRAGPLADAHRAAHAALKKPQWFFTVRGAFGTGKTGLLCAIVNEAIKLGIPAIYTTMADLLDALKKDFDHYDENLQRFRQATILAIDEFDRIKLTDWAEQVVFQLLEYRYEHGPSLLTVLATNAPIEELPGYLASRIEDKRCQVFTLAGPSLRKGAST